MSRGNLISEKSAFITRKKKMQITYIYRHRDRKKISDAKENYLPSGAKEGKERRGETKRRKIRYRLK
jgi:hypothetical protein